jgi:hypothetical protein
MLELNDVELIKTNKQREEANGNYSVDRLSSTSGRRTSNLALQQRVGLLSERRGRAYCSGIDRVTSGGSLIATCFFVGLNLFPLKILDDALVSFRCFSGSESSEIAPSACARILLAGV